MSDFPQRVHRMTESRSSASQYGHGFTPGVSTRKGPRLSAQPRPFGGLDVPSPPDGPFGVASLGMELPRPGEETAEQAFANATEPTCRRGVPTAGR
jgi:hypothetical protein